jgi:catechol 2,3-dioxygenase-like lactoylglutathione lyase family enzyme
MRFRPSTSILRITNEQQAKSFYVDWLGFEVDWEHRFEDNFPIYMQVSLDETKLQLTEHAGDCSPGGAVRIESTELENFVSELSTKNPELAATLKIEDTTWKTRDLTITDPFGNRLTFWSPVIE